jgi:peroxisomal 2,4-dienoyl-CoA reductase|eukprot:COSAG06_NODE_4841_length_3916_cov_1.775478_3_plen_137_part_00
MNRWEDFRVWSSTSPFRADILDDRVALVTGGGSGIGYEMARQLGLHGAKLVLVGRRATFLEDACAGLRAEGIECTYAAGDVRKPEDCEAAVAVAETTYGCLNVLINGAAGMFPASIGESLSPNGFKTVIEIDVLGT